MFLPQIQLEILLQLFPSFPSFIFSFQQKYSDVTRPDQK